MSTTLVRAIPTGTAYKTPLPDQPALWLLGMHIVKPQVSAEQAAGQMAVYEADLSPGRFIPLHSHPEVEWMYVLEGVLQVLTYRDGDPYWLDIVAGESLLVPSNVRHALRNTARVPMRLFCVSPASTGRYFEEVGRPVTPDGLPPVQTPEWQQEFFAAALHRGYWVGSREENAEVGLSI